MNIEFPDRLSAVCFHNMVRDDRHREAFVNWLTPFMWGSWMQDTGPWVLDARGKPDWAQQSGRMAKLIISVYNNDIYMTEDGPMAPEFNWYVRDCECDTYGRLPDVPKWRSVINGGWINHGTHDKPDWSSHT